jgi:formylglycine-generating enzyme required for sulfatase activity
MNRAVLLAAVLGLLLSSVPAGAEAPRVVTNSLGMKLAPIAAGQFQMGAEATLRDAGADERPVHPVQLSRPFHIGVYEVTQEEFRKVMSSSPSFFAADGPGKSLVKGLDTTGFPVDQVRFIDAVEFCRKLTGSAAEKKAGRFYRLPTEAEWEYALRAGTKTPYFWGTELKKGVDYSASVTRLSGVYYFPPVGSKKPNPWGLHDMSGSVYEYLLDRQRTYTKEPVVDPLGQIFGALRYDSHRGGVKIHRSAYRGTGTSFLSNKPYFGFRLVRAKPIKK